MTLKNQYQNARPVGVHCICNFGGLAILDICGDYIVSAWEFGNGYENIRRTKVHYTTTGRAFIRRGNTRFYLDTIMRIC